VVLRRRRLASIGRGPVFRPPQGNDFTAGTRSGSSRRGRAGRSFVLMEVPAHDHPTLDGIRGSIAGAVSHVALDLPRCRIAATPGA